MHLRRDLAILLVLPAAALAAVLGGQHASTLRPRPGKTPVFVQDPYMGVACHVPNSIACDRIGLAVWLARPATVTATLDGASFRLDDPTWSYATHQGDKPLYVYAGFLHPAGLGTRLHLVTAGGSPLIRFRIDHGDGRVVTVRQHVWLNAGWG